MVSLNSFYRQVSVNEKMKSPLMVTFIFSCILHLLLLPLIKTKIFVEKQPILQVKVVSFAVPKKRKPLHVTAKKTKIRKIARKQTESSLWQPEAVVAPVIKNQQNALALNKSVRQNNFIGNHRLVKKQNSLLEAQSTSIKRSTNSTASYYKREKNALGNRKIIYRPLNPKLRIADTMRLPFRITVLSNGIVSKVMPLKKADPKLEKIAKNLLLKYRFEALEYSREEQQGVFTIVLQRE